MTRTRCVYAGVVLIAACTDSGPHIYSARQYEPAGGCLDSPVAIDVINTGQTSDGCATECFVVPGMCGSVTRYVSNQCPPYPAFSGPGFAVESADEIGDAADPCHEALAAFADGGVCPTPDAGADAAEAGADAGDTGAADVMGDCE